MLIAPKVGIRFLLLILAAALIFAGRVQAQSAASDRSTGITAVRIGLANHYKVGHWTPVWVEVAGPSALAEPRVEVTVDDSDGVATTASAPLQLAESEGDSTTAVVFTKVGRTGGSIAVVLYDGEREIDRTTVRPGSRATANAALVDLPATAEMIVTLGHAAPGLAEAIGERDAGPGQPARRAVLVEQVADLPRDWFGYEAVDVMVLDAAEPALLRELGADEQRFAALVRWVDLGGRLVILAGGQNASEMLAEDGPLAPLSPGKFAQVVRLPETGPLEHFAQDAALPSPAAREPILVPQLEDVQDNIELYAGRLPTDLPLVVRSPRGLGEVTFAGVDLGTPPLADWAGRKAFLQALMRPYLTEAEGTAAQTLVTRGYNDLSGALRQRLGQSFAGAAPIGFSVVALLAIAYLVVLGPLDYLLVHRWLRRPWMAWITLPAIVLLFGIGAIVLADWRSGGKALSVNSAEIVDVDVASGQARGSYWATVYSPYASQLDLALGMDAMTGGSAAEADVLLSWWGLPGVGIGGMQSGGGANLPLARGGYRYASDLGQLHSVPILTSSTKSLLARWTAPSGDLIEAQLTDVDRLVEGKLVNRSDREWRNVRLFYKGWAYTLGNMKPGQTIDVSDEISPRLVRTIVMQQVLGATAVRTEGGGLFVAERASAQQILSLMMFYRLAGGSSFAGLPNNVQKYCDLSRQLDLGRAILAAEVAGGSRLVASGGVAPTGNEPADRAVLYRFVLPVTK